MQFLILVINFIGRTEKRWMSLTYQMLLLECKIALLLGSILTQSSQVRLCNISHFCLSLRLYSLSNILFLSLIQNVYCFVGINARILSNKSFTWSNSCSDSRFLIVNHLGIFFQQYCNTVIRICQYLIIKCSQVHLL